MMDNFSFQYFSSPSLFLGFQTEMELNFDNDR